MRLRFRFPASDFSVLLTFARQPPAVGWNPYAGLLDYKKKKKKKKKILLDNSEGEPPSKRPQTKGERLHAYCQRFPNLPPLVVGHPKLFMSQIQEDGTRIHCNRPLELSNLPLALLLVNRHSRSLTAGF